MSVLSEDNFSELMVDRHGVRAIARKRALPYELIEYPKSKAPPGPPAGTYLLEELKTKVKFAKDKPNDELFEDRVWLMLAKMGFSFLSASRRCSIAYGDTGGAAQQIDVLAVDEETAIIVECKASTSEPPRLATFKTTIEAIGGKKAGLIRELRRLFSKPKLKVGFLLLTKGYRIGDSDRGRLESFSIKHMSEVDLEYYEDLVGHIGASARFQLEADIFPGIDIPELESRVHAIQGSMGGHTYYSFSIEPARLLKVSYVLHRSRAVTMLPSYQRLIKKSRLSGIREFINGGGYFPNSVILSLDSRGKGLRFDQAGPPIDGATTRMGTLYLPNRYRSAYIIDGQHRLFGYGETDYSEKNAIPVVAFVDLDRSEQLRVFMEINENQKSVSKNLKHTLDADLKWDSDNLRDRAEALKKQLAQDLGESASSGLYGRVVIGEDLRTDFKVVTIEAILKGLNRTKFVGKFTKDAVREHGVFNTGDSARTLERISRFLGGYFTLVSEELDMEWNLAPKDGGLLGSNDGVTALIMLSGDLVEELVSLENIDPLSATIDTLLDFTRPYLQTLSHYFADMDEQERFDLKTKYGSGASTRLWRVLQRALSREISSFCPTGLEDYWKDQGKKFNAQAFSRVQDIELHMKDLIKETLLDTYGNMWLKRCMPAEMYGDLSKEAAKKNVSVEREEDEKTPWDCMSLIQYRAVVSYKDHWSKLFQKRFTIPGEESLKKEDRTKWIVELNRIRNKVDHEYSVTQSEFDFLDAIYDWLILDDAEKIVAASDRQGT